MEEQCSVAETLIITLTCYQLCRCNSTAAIQIHKKYNFCIFVCKINLSHNTQFDTAVATIKSTKGYMNANTRPQIVFTGIRDN